MIHSVVVQLDYGFKPPSCYCQLMSVSTQHLHQLKCIHLVTM